MISDICKSIVAKSVTRFSGRIQPWGCLVICLTRRDTFKHSPCLYLSTYFQMVALPSLIAFGSLAPWPDADRLQQLRIALREQPSLKPIVEAIYQLPLLWKALESREPGLKAVAGKPAADQLAEWITGTNNIQHVDEKRNLMIMPMTIITQIVYYFSYLGQSGGAFHHGSVLESVAAGGGIQGFCTGLLSAIAVASGKNQEDTGNFAATSVKLAFCIGAYVDLDQCRDGGASKDSTLAVRWRTPTTLENIQRLYLNHPNVSSILPCLIFEFMSIPY